MLPASSSASVSIAPRDGTYKGHFSQGFTDYSMELNLQFKEVDFPSEPNIRVFEVLGEGTDEMGTFKISCGECQLGMRSLLFFQKYYVKMNPPHTPEVIHPLLYFGSLSSKNVGCISGTWKFVDAETAKNIPHISGSFELELDNSVEETTIEMQPTPKPIELEKTPLI